MKYVIITGGSKGLGKGCAEEYLNKGYRVLSISRTKNEIEHPNLSQFEYDLTLVNEFLDKFIYSVFNEIKSPKSITLINNAGRLGEINKLDRISSTNISKTINLNISAPLAISGLFISHFKAFTGKKNIINISSGASLNPYFGWSVYCSSKSAINMMSATIAEEQKNEENPVKVLSLAPGVVDTNMQSKIRSSSKDAFINIDRFIELKETNSLSDPNYVAKQIFQLDEENTFVSGEYLDVRKL